MRRRILTAIVAVAVMATTVLTVPLAIITAHREQDLSIREMESVADQAAAGIPSDPTAESEEIKLPTVESNIELGVYLPDGTRIAGTGPKTADAITKRVDRAAIDGAVGDSRVLGEPVVVDEQTVAVVRVSEPLAESAGELRKALAILLGVDIAAIAVAASIGWLVAARLAQPVGAIRDDAVRLGEGDFSIVPHTSGIAELDDTAAALAETADRIGQMLARERAFSADASHQLRTPLAALRLSIETEMLAPRIDHTLVLSEAVDEIDRLEDTVTTLLSLARGGSSPREPLDVDQLEAEIVGRWSGRLATTGRALRYETAGPISVCVSRAVIDQVVAVLLDNAVEHGSGTVSVLVTQSADNLVVSVTDDGALDRDPTMLFTRQDPAASGHGVGLDLARTLAQGQGGRLVLASEDPAAFRLILPG